MRLLKWAQDWPQDCLDHSGPTPTCQEVSPLQPSQSVLLQGTNYNTRKSLWAPHPLSVVCYRRWMGCVGGWPIILGCYDIHINSNTEFSGKSDEWSIPNNHNQLWNPWPATQVLGWVFYLISETLSSSSKGLRVNFSRDIEVSLKPFGISDR